MKKVLALLCCSLFALSLVGCSGGDTAGDAPTAWVENTSREPERLDYVVTALATDHEINANLVDGLLENDRYGNLVGALAETWESNEDQTVWTFHLREGVKWVTNSGEEYATVTADDFVTGVRHGAEFGSGTAYLLQGVVKGYSEYTDTDTSTFSDEEWANVGVKAVDDLTVEFTLENPTPYFPSMTTYAVLYPVNRTFLESMGEGCKLGSPDPATCGFGTVEMDSILYNGAYILTTYDQKSQLILTKNDSYWDAEHVYMETVTRIYDDGSDPYSGIKGFEDGTYVSASLNTTWADYADYKEKYADNAYESLPNASVFGVVFNFNRQEFNYTEYADDLELRENTREAILNDNFRKALRAAFDRVAYNSVSTTEEIATDMLRNVNNFPSCGTLSDGTTYFELVTQVYNENTGENVDLNDGVNPWDPSTALDYIEAAKAEGIEFPVYLDMLVINTSDRLVKQASSMKQSVEENTDGQIIIELVLEEQNTVESIAYTNMDPAKSDYDISTFTGWSPDYTDPKSFVDIYSSTAGYYMTSLGLGMGENDKEIKDTVGLTRYEELYRAADAITDDTDARYRAFAEADSYLVERCFYIPGYMDARGEVVSRIVPFTRPYAQTGISEYKYKGVQLQNDIVTLEQYNAAYEEWQAGMGSGNAE